MIPTWRTVQLTTALYATLLAPYAWSGPLQTVAVAGDVVALPSATFAVELIYSTSDTDASLTGLGLRIHFDATKLTWVQNTFLNDQDLIGASAPTPDTEDFDNSPATDTYIQFAWASLNGSWPGQIPAILANLEFSTPADFTGTTLNLTAGDTATGYSFQSAPIQVLLGSAADPYDDLNGVVYHWSQHTLIADAAVSLEGTEVVVANTNASGYYVFEETAEATYAIAALVSITERDTNRTITSADALAALKIAVGLNPNADPDGDGPLEPLSISPYQLIAADMNQDGRVTSSDALAILKVAVGLPEAIMPSWVLVEDSQPLWQTHSDKGTVFDANQSVELLYPEQTEVNFAAVLMGDVNSSWKPVDGVSAVDHQQFSDWAKVSGAPLSLWGIRDVDGDSVADTADAFPFDSTESVDTDADGTGNNADTDDDGDGVADNADAFPLDSTESVDTDADGTGDNADTDDDGDNVPDEDDGYPLIPIGILLDTDLDGIPDDCDSTCLQLGMLADTDDDNDGVLDYEDPFPKDGSISMSKAIPAIIDFLR
jgi:hypothetical protein